MNVLNYEPIEYLPKREREQTDIYAVRLLGRHSAADAWHVVHRETTPRWRASSMRLYQRLESCADLSPSKARTYYWRLCVTPIGRAGWLEWSLQGRYVLSNIGFGLATKLRKSRKIAA